MGTVRCDHTGSIVGESWKCVRPLHGSDLITRIKGCLSNAAGAAAPAEIAPFSVNILLIMVALPWRWERR
jgi:hypothetical protein